MSREGLINSAVTFLRDPTTASSPLAQKISFLESKGLNSTEIEQALSLAKGPGPPGGLPSIGQRSGYGPYYGNRQEYDRDWRDWFIMAVIGGGVGYLGIKLAQKFLMPHLQPPSETELEAAQKALEAKYDEAARIMDTLQASTASIEASLDEQKVAVEAEIEDVRKAVGELRIGEQKRNDWCTKIEGQIDEIARNLPALIEKQAENQTQSLTDLQNELKSLKSLLAARTSTQPNRFGNSGSTSGDSTPTSSFSRPGFPTRSPGLPAWQLKPKPAATSTPLESSTTAKEQESEPEPYTVGAREPKLAETTGDTEGKESDKDDNAETSASGILVEKPESNE